MRFGWKLEHLFLLITLIITTFCCFDEEPVLDWSDLNLIHIWLMVLSALVVYFDLLLRSRVGQYVMKDLTVAVAAFTFIWGLENYVRIILLVFCIHNLLPLEIDLMEMVEIYQSWGVWLSSEMLVGSLGLGLLLGLTYLLNLTLPANNYLLISSLVLILVLGHLTLIVVLGWDLALSGLSSFSTWEENEVFYQQPSAAWTYDRALNSGDLFEWHRERTWPYSIRFEDLYFFFFQLLLIWDLMCSLFFWSMILATSFTFNGRAVSFTQVAIGLTWMEHLCCALLGLLVGLTWVGLRVWSRLPVELGFSWGS